MFSNGLIDQWYAVNEYVTAQRTLTLVIALNSLFFAFYGCGMNTDSTFPSGVNLFGVFCNFKGTEITYYLRGGDGGTYIRNGYLLIMGN